MQDDGLTDEDLAEWAESAVQKHGPGCGYCRSEPAAALTVRLLQFAIDRQVRVKITHVHRKVEERCPTGHKYAKFCTHLSECLPELYRRFRAIP